MKYKKIKKFKKIILFVSVILLISNKIYALKPDTTYSFKPIFFGLMFKELDIYTSDNIRLKAWFYPEQNALDKDSAKYYFDAKNILRPFVVDTLKKNPTIVICNGDAGNMQYLMGYAYYYCTHGFNVLTFDWRGFGQSEYFPIDTSFLVYTEFITDYNAAIDAVKKIETVDKNRIGVFGFSTGAFLSFAIASEREDVKAIVARGIFTDYKSVIKGLKKINPNKKLIFPNEIDNYSPKNKCANFNKPIFLIVRSNDKRTPKENSIEIITNVKSMVRELWIVAGAGHGGLEAPEYVESELFNKKTLRFFVENLK